MNDSFWLGYGAAVAGLAVGFVISEIMQIRSSERRMREEGAHLEKMFELSRRHMENANNRKKEAGFSADQQTPS